MQVIIKLSNPPLPGGCTKINNRPWISLHEVNLGLLLVGSQLFLGKFNKLLKTRFWLVHVSANLVCGHLKPSGFHFMPSLDQTILFKARIFRF